MTERTLILLRHAQADQPPAQADIDRELTDCGRADARSAGAWLAAHDYLPDLVICSPAVRTRQTWQAVADALPGTAPEVHYERMVYEGDADDLLALVQETDEEVGRLLVIGHNPSVSLLSIQLDPTGGGAEPEGLRTAGIAVHRMSSSWADLRFGSAPILARHTARA